MNAQQPQHPNGSTETAVSSVIEVYRPVVRSMTECGNVLCDGYAAIGTEWLAFVNRRLQSGLSLPVRLAECSNPQDLMQEWAGFMNSAADDYRREIACLSAIGSATSQKAVTALQATSVVGKPDWLWRRP